MSLIILFLAKTLCLAHLALSLFYLHTIYLNLQHLSSFLSLLLFLHLSLLLEIIPQLLSERYIAVEILVDYWMKRTTIVIVFFKVIPKSFEPWLNILDVHLNGLFVIIFVDWTKLNLLEFYGLIFQMSDSFLPNIEKVFNLFHGLFRKQVEELLLFHMVDPLFDAHIEELFDFLIALFLFNQFTPISFLNKFFNMVKFGIVFAKFTLPNLLYMFEPSLFVNFIELMSYSNQFLDLIELQAFEILNFYMSFPLLRAQNFQFF